MQDVRVKWNPGPSCKKQHSTRRRRCPPVNWIQIKETAFAILHFERSFYGAESETLREVGHKYSTNMLRLFIQCIVTKLHIHKTNIW